MDFREGAALGTALAALFAIWLAERRSRFDARRSFVEFTLKQRTETAAELMGALTCQMQLVHQAFYWNAELRAGRNVEDAARERNRTRDELLPLGTRRMNDALAAAGLVFSGAVIAEANAAVDMLNELGRQQAPIPVPVFDHRRSIELLSRVAAALRAEMLFPQVLNYQQQLFEPTLSEWVSRIWKKRD